MKIIKKSNICSYKANEKALNNKNIDGLHFITKSGFSLDRESIEKHIYTRKPIIYQTSNDETSSYDYTIYNLIEFKRKFPNMIVSLADYGMALNIKEMLELEGINLEVITPVSKSTDGDFIEYTQSSLNEKDRTNVSKMLELLREKKRIILDYETYKDPIGLEVLDELERKSQNTNNVLLSKNILTMFTKSVYVTLSILISFKFLIIY